MRFSKLLVHTVLALFIFSPNAQADNEKGNLTLTVYHDKNGKLTNESRRHAATMRKIAARQGFVTIWLTANVEFDPNVADLTDAERTAQEAAAADKLMEVLQPLVDAGQVWHPTAGPYMQGPGCIIRANAAGVSKLVRDSRILHMVART